MILIGPCDKRTFSEGSPKSWRLWNTSFSVLPDAKVLTMLRTGILPMGSTVMPSLIQLRAGGLSTKYQLLPMLTLCCTAVTMVYVYGQNIKIRRDNHTFSYEHSGVYESVDDRNLFLFVSLKPTEKKLVQQRVNDKHV